VPAQVALVPWSEQDVQTAQLAAVATTHEVPSLPPQVPL
jgi:hypothetical protein